MKRLLGWTFIFLVGCQNEIDIDLARIGEFENQLKNPILLDSLPYNADSLLMEFVSKYPKNPKSESYCYYASAITETRGMHLRAAQLAEYYLNNFKGTRERRMEQAVVAAHYYEKQQVFDKALIHYKYLSDSFSNLPVGVQAKQMVVFIEKGLLTPEQQLEYILQNNPRLQN